MRAARKFMMAALCSVAFPPFANLGKPRYHFIWADEWTKYAPIAKDLKPIGLRGVESFGSLYMADSLRLIEDEKNGKAKASDCDNED